MHACLCFHHAWLVSQPCAVSVCMRLCKLAVQTNANVFTWLCKMAAAAVGCEKGCLPSAARLIPEADMYNRRPLTFLGDDGQEPIDYAAQALATARWTVTVIIQYIHRLCFTNHECDSRL